MSLSQIVYLSIPNSVLLTLITASPLSPRADNLGLRYASNSGCGANTTTQILNAISDARTLSNSAIDALANPGSNPAAYFFPSSAASNTKQVFDAVLAVTQPLQAMPTDPSTNINPIELYCTDLSNLCSTNSPGNTPGSSTARWGYVPENANPKPGYGTAQIVICPPLLDPALPRNPPHCTGIPGQASLGWAFLRTFLTLQSVQSGFPKISSAHAISDMAPGVEQSHALVKSGKYESNADNYAEMATWAYDLGTNAQGMTCPQNWPSQYT